MLEPNEKALKLIQSFSSKKDAQLCCKIILEDHVIGRDAERYWERVNKELEAL